MMVEVKDRMIAPELCLLGCEPPMCQGEAG